MKNKASACITTMAALLLAGTAVQAETNISGVNAVVVPVGAEVVLAVPFSQVAAAELTVSSVSGNVVTLSAAADAYGDGTYYVRFVNGGGEGLWSTITAASGTQVTLESAAVAAEATVGSKVRIIKHHTVNSLFPAGMAGISYAENVKVFTYANDISAPQSDKASVAEATYYGVSDGWVGGENIVAPETEFIVRNESVQSITFVHAGVAADFNVSMLLPASGDLNIGSGYGLPVQLNKLGLESGTNAELRIVFIYDNSIPGIDKGSDNSATYYGPGDGWTDLLGTGNATPLLPSVSFILRVPEGSDGKITFKKPY